MRLAKRQPDGSTLRQHLLAGAAATGKPRPELLAEEPPEASALWDAFTALSGARQAGLNGAAPISPGEIDAWSRLHRVQLSPWEIDTLQAMDRAVMAVLAEKGSGGLQ